MAARAAGSSDSDKCLSAALRACIKSRGTSVDIVKEIGHKPLRDGGGRLRRGGTGGIFERCIVRHFRRNHRFAGLVHREFGDHLWLALIEELEILFLQCSDGFPLPSRTTTGTITRFTLVLKVAGASCDVISAVFCWVCSVQSNSGDRSLTDESGDYAQQQ